MVIRRTRNSIDDNPWWGQCAMLPIINVCAKSLSSPAFIAKHPLMLLPYGLNLDAYNYIFSTKVLMASFGITLYATIVGTFFNLLFTTLAAYGLSKTYLPGHKYLIWIVIFPMLFGAGLIPHYILLKNLGLLNNIWVRFCHY